MPSWGVFDLQMNLNLDTKITLTFVTSKKKLLHCPPLSLSLIFIVKYFIHMTALKITLLGLSFLINAFLNKFWDSWLFPTLPYFFSNYIISMFPLTQMSFTEGSSTIESNPGYPVPFLLSCFLDRQPPASNSLIHGLIPPQIQKSPCTKLHLRCTFLQLV